MRLIIGNRGHVYFPDLLLTYFSEGRKRVNWSLEIILMPAHQSPEFRFPNECGIIPSRRPPHGAVENRV